MEYSTEILSPNLREDDQDRMMCPRAGCYRRGAPQNNEETVCRACGTRTVPWQPATE